MRARHPRLPLGCIQHCWEPLQGAAHWGAAQFLRCGRFVRSLVPYPSAYLCAVFLKRASQLVPRGCSGSAPVWRASPSSLVPWRGTGERELSLSRPRARAGGPGPNDVCTTMEPRPPAPCPVRFPLCSVGFSPFPPRPLPPLGGGGARGW